MKLYYIDCDNNACLFPITFYKNSHDAWGALARTNYIANVTIHTIETKFIIFSFTHRPSIKKRNFFSKPSIKITTTLSYKPRIHGDYPTEKVGFYLDSMLTHVDHQEVSNELIIDSANKDDRDLSITKITTSAGNFTLKEIKLNEIHD